MERDGLMKYLTAYHYATEELLMEDVKLELVSQSSEYLQPLSDGELERLVPLFHSKLGYRPSVHTVRWIVERMVA